MIMLECHFATQHTAFMNVAPHILSGPKLFSFLCFFFCHVILKQLIFSKSSYVRNLRENNNVTLSLLMHSLSSLEC